MGEFDRFRALSFDCYGTLIDWEAGILAALRPWTSRHGLGDDVVLEALAANETAVQTEHPTMRYPDILATTIDRVAAQLDADVTAEERSAFAASVPDWPAFPDSTAALTALQQRFKLVILSNIDHRSFAASAARLAIEFDHIVTAEDVGSYKPNPANFDALLAALPELGLERTELLHVAQSLYHDHVPAKAIGLPTVWIDRRHDRAGSGATPPAAPVTPDWRFDSMADFAAAATA